MPGCVLRVSGKNLDIDALLASISLVPCHVERKGQPRFERSKRIATYSGFNVSTSDAPGTDVPSQVRDTVAFLQTNREDLQQVMHFPGVEDARLDFGIACRLGDEVAAQFDYYPPDLLRLAGELGLGIEISLYPIMPEDQEQVLSSRARSLTILLNPMLEALEAARRAAADAVGHDDEVTVDDQGDHWSFEFVPQGEALGGGARVSIAKWPATGRRDRRRKS